MICRLPTWRSPTAWWLPIAAPRWDALPLNARRYLERVQEHIGAPIDMVSTGPDRDHTILLRHPYQADAGFENPTKGTAC